MWLKKPGACKKRIREFSMRELGGSRNLGNTVNCVKKKKPFSHICSLSRKLVGVLFWGKKFPFLNDPNL